MTEGSGPGGENIEGTLKIKRGNTGGLGPGKRRVVQVDALS